MPGLKPIIQFSQENAFLSNFFPSPLKVNGLVWPTVEHIYQAYKASEVAERELVRLCPLAKDAKKMGQTFKLPADWETKKMVVMQKILEKKFAHGSELAQKLLDTKHCYLIEGNYWHDNFWGDCICWKCNQIPGQNQLGILLMERRDEILSEVTKDNLLSKGYNLEELEKDNPYS